MDYEAVHTKTCEFFFLSCIPLSGGEMTVEVVEDEATNINIVVELIY